MKKIITKDRDGKRNGYLIPLYNINDNIIKGTIEQVYLTVCMPGTVKGPHLHKKRVGNFTCICGNVRIITRKNGMYYHQYSGEHYDYATIHVPKGIPAAVQNIGKKPAFIINLTYPAWRKDDPDSHPVEFNELIFGNLEDLNKMVRDQSF